MVKFVHARDNASFTLTTQQGSENPKEVVILQPLIGMKMRLYVLKLLDKPNFLSGPSSPISITDMPMNMSNGL